MTKSKTYAQHQYINMEHNNFFYINMYCIYKEYLLCIKTGNIHISTKKFISAYSPIFFRFFNKSLGPGCTACIAPDEFPNKASTWPTMHMLLSMTQHTDNQVLTVFTGFNRFLRVLAGNCYLWVFWIPCFNIDIFWIPNGF